MRTTLSGLLLSLIFCLPAVAQVTPEIVAFTYDGIPLVYAEVEQGIASSDFSWQAVGVVAPYRMRMHALVGGRWVLIGEDFSPAKSDTLVIAHPLDFSQPVYRLSIVNAQGEIIDETQLRLTYAPTNPAGSPEITAFTMSSGHSVSKNALMGGNILLYAAWEVINRPPNTNLIFEQVMPDNTWQAIDLPRQESWVRSAGSGVIAPIGIPNQNTLTLQIRLVDIVTGETLSTRQTVLTVVDGAVDLLPSPIPTITPGVYPHQLIDFVTPNLVTLGSSMVLHWDASAASAYADTVVVREWHNLSFGGKYAEQARYIANEGDAPVREWGGLPLSGDLLMTAPQTFPAGSLPNGDIQNVVVFALYLQQAEEDVTMGSVQYPVYLRTVEQAASCTPSIEAPQQVISGEDFSLTWDTCGLPFVQLEVEPDNAQTWYPYRPLYGKDRQSLRITLNADQETLAVDFRLHHNQTTILEHTVTIVQPASE